MQTKLDKKRIDFLKSKALFCRLETIRLISIAKVGHYTSVFSCAEIFAALFYDTMRLKCFEPNWQERDRFTMGKGHAAVGLYPILAELGFFPPELLNEYTQLGNPLGDHPDRRKVPGIDFSSGSIGHAISAALGMLLAGRMMKKNFHAFVLVGDGEMQEGQVWEAALSASHHHVANLIVIVDKNGYQLDGNVDDIIAIEPLAKKWTAFGWEVHEVNGHNMEQLATLLRQVREDQERTKPCCIIANTVKGKGIKYMETEPGWHLGYLAPVDEKRAIEELKKGTF
ncbi:MAG: transketolase [Ostreibacterium sp.]